MAQQRRRHVGEFFQSGDWSDYWTTRISRAETGRIWVRGYPLEEIVDKLSFVEAMWLLIRGELPSPRQAAVWELTMKIAMDQQRAPPGSSPPHTPSLLSPAWPRASWPTVPSPVRPARQRR